MESQEKRTNIETNQKVELFHTGVLLKFVFFIFATLQKCCLLAHPNNCSLFFSTFTALITVLAFLLASIDATRTVDSFLSKPDHQRLDEIFNDGVKSTDLQSIYYSAINSKAIPADVKSNLCKKLSGLHAESKLNVSFFLQKDKGLNHWIKLSLLGLREKLLLCWSQHNTPLQRENSGLGHWPAQIVIWQGF